MGGRRLPFGPKGIIVVSTTAPFLGILLIPSAPIPVPTSTGLGVTAFGAHLASLRTNGLTTLVEQIWDGEWCYLNLLAAITGPAVLVPGLFTLDEYLFVEGTHFPANATGIRGRVGCVVNAAGGSAIQYEYNTGVFDLSGGGLVNRVAGRLQIQAVQEFAVPGGGTSVFRQDFKVPRIFPGSGISPINIGMTVDWNIIAGGGPTKVSEFTEIYGWKL